MFWNLLIILFFKILKVKKLNILKYLIINWIYWEMNFMILLIDKIKNFNFKFFLINLKEIFKKVYDLSWL